MAIVEEIFIHILRLLFLVGMRVQCIFSKGMEFQGIFLTGADRGRILDHFFQWGGVPTGSVTQGCFLKQNMFPKIQQQFLSRQKQLQKTFETFDCSYVTTTKIVSLKFFSRWVGPLETVYQLNCNFFMFHIDEKWFTWPRTLTVNSLQPFILIIYYFSFI